MQAKIIARLETSDHDGYCSGGECEYECKVIEKTVDAPTQYQNSKPGKIADLEEYDWHSCLDAPKLNTHESYYCDLSPACENIGLERHDYKYTIVSVELRGEPITSIISNLRVQNAGLETSFQKRQTEFVKQDIVATADESEAVALQTYNAYLKYIAKQTRPVVAKEKGKGKEKGANEKGTNEKEKEETFDDAKPVFSKFTDMSDMKRAYFSEEPELFSQFDVLRNAYPFRFYRASYKHADEYAGRPTFVAKNLIRGLVRNLEAVGDYMMVRFQCIMPAEATYAYPSYWIINSSEPLQTLLGSMYDDFDFSEMTEPEIVQGWTKRNADEEDEHFVGELYLH